MNSSSGSSTVTMTTGDSSLANSQQLPSSVSSRSPHRKPSSGISKAYKHASQLFVTRRFAEALSLLEPIVTPTKEAKGYKDGDEYPSSEGLLATTTTSQRIKVWVLYITLLNSIVDLGQEEGKRCFGQTRYKEIVTGVRNGDIWETVVRDGYGGNEGSVDAEVVYNLATLLLGQAPSQALTQSRLESYLASSSRMDLNLTQHFDHHASHQARSRTNGTDTPKDLTTRLKILELFTLHVLPRNEEWEYARSFISMSDVLDDERREAFLQSLQELQDVKEQELQEEVATLQQEKDENLHEQLADKNRIEAESAASQRRSSGHNGSAHKRTSSEIDYGIEKKQPNGSTGLPPEIQKVATPSDAATAAAARQSHNPPPSEASKSRSMRKSPQKRLPTYVQQVRNLFRLMQNVVRNMASSIGGNPTMLFKMMFLVLAIIMALSRRDIRDRARRILSNGMDKVRNTIGMGVKVSYI